MSQIDEARDWLEDVFPHTGFDSFDLLETHEIWDAIDRYYAGGLAQFSIDAEARDAAERVAARARAASRLVESRRAVICDPKDTECTIDHPWRHSAAHWNKAVDESQPDEYALGSCGCTDYHLADCPTRSPWVDEGTMAFLVDPDDRWEE